MEGGGKDPPPCYNEIKKPSAYRVIGRIPSGPDNFNIIKLLNTRL